MTYKITSDRLDCAKSQGDSITEKELLEMGANIEALIEGGHIESDAAKTKPIVEQGATANG
jgi:hypothetical protein